MNKPSTLIWMVFMLLLIVPTPAGKLIIDLAGGIFLIITIIPLILGGFGWLAWKKLQSKIQTCPSCGSSFIDNQIICPICGIKINSPKENPDNTPASSVIIDIKSEDID